jgi:Skp family chaperone for outer membrane proteins
MNPRHGWSLVFVLAAATLAAATTMDASAIAASPIAVLDVQSVLEQYGELQQRLAEIHTAAELAQARLEQLQRQLAERRRRLAALRAGTREHTRLDVEIVQLARQIRDDGQRVRQRRQTAEAQAHRAAYEALVQATRQFLDDSDVQIVLRKGSEAAAGLDLRSLAAPPRDISAEILRRMNRDAARRLAARPPTRGR